MGIIMKLTELNDKVYEECKAVGHSWQKATQSKYLEATSRSLTILLSWVSALALTPVH